MAGNWLNRLPGWSVAQGSGRAPTGARRRYVMKAPNGRRWEHVSADGNALLDATRALHALGRCSKGEPLDSPLPAGVLPEGTREIEQRQCRTCTRILEIGFFSHAGGKARSCNGCITRRCSAAPGEKPIPKASLVPCPVCEEPGPSAHLQHVDGLGVACRGCADVAKEAAAKIEAPIVLPVIERPRLRIVPPPPPVVARQLCIAGTEVYRLPQASDLGRLRVMLEAVAAGLTDARRIGTRMGAKTKGAARHASYYRQAAEILGLLEERRWALTPLGKRVLAAPAGSVEARDLLRSAVAGADELGPLGKAVLGHEAPSVEQIVVEMAALLPGLSAATVRQRVRATLQWRKALGFAPVGRRGAAVVVELVPRPVVRDLEPAMPSVRPEDFEALRPACFAF